MAAALSVDGSRLLTCSEDGVLFVSTLKFVVDGSALDPPGEPVAPFPKVCLVLEEAQAEQTQQLSDMQAQLKRGKEDTEYQVHRRNQLIPPPFHHIPLRSLDNRCVFYIGGFLFFYHYIFFVFCFVFVLKV